MKTAHISRFFPSSTNTDREERLSVVFGVKQVKKHALLIDLNKSARAGDSTNGNACRRVRLDGYVMGFFIE